MTRIIIPATSKFNYARMGMGSLVVMGLLGNIISERRFREQTSIEDGRIVHISRRWQFQLIATRNINFYKEKFIPGKEILSAEQKITRIQVCASKGLKFLSYPTPQTRSLATG
jgi:hypothetical protein